MTQQSSNARSSTADDIVAIAESLIQTRGYSAFSYQDIADALGIRKASIHYHFASKADLGAAVVERYAGRFQSALEQLAADQTRDTPSMLNLYFGPYLEFAESPDKVCLCGALAGELMVLPPAMRARVEAFFVAHQAWLKKTLERGVKRGEFKLSADAGKTSRLVFGALQGALMVKRTTGDISQVFDVIAALKAEFGVTAAKPTARAKRIKKTG